MSRKRTRRGSRLVGSSESGGEVPMEAVAMLRKGKRVGNLRKEWERSHVQEELRSDWRMEGWLALFCALQ